jgi:hypothetical protein
MKRRKFLGFIAAIRAALSTHREYQHFVDRDVEFSYPNLMAPNKPSNVLPDLQSLLAPKKQ